MKHRIFPIVYSRRVLWILSLLHALAANAQDEDDPDSSDLPLAAIRDKAPFLRVKSGFLTIGDSPLQSRAIEVVGGAYLDTNALIMLSTEIEQFEKSDEEIKHLEKRIVELTTHVRILEEQNKNLGEVIADRPKINWSKVIAFTFVVGIGIGVGVSLILAPLLKGQP